MAFSHAAQFSSFYYYWLASRGEYIYVKRFTRPGGFFSFRLAMCATSAWYLGGIARACAQGAVAAAATAVQRIYFDHDDAGPRKIFSAQNPAPYFHRRNAVAPRKVKLIVPILCAK